MVLCDGCDCDNKEKDMGNICCNYCNNTSCEERCFLDSKKCDFSFDDFR